MHSCRGVSITITSSRVHPHCTCTPPVRPLELVACHRHRKNGTYHVSSIWFGISHTCFTNTHTFNMILSQISYLDCIAFLVFLAPQILIQIGLFPILKWLIPALPWLGKYSMHMVYTILILTQHPKSLPSRINSFRSASSRHMNSVHLSSRRPHPFKTL